MTTWTKTPPSESGWHWWRSSRGALAYPIYWYALSKSASSFDIGTMSRRTRSWGKIGEWWPVRIEPPKEQA